MIFRLSHAISVSLVPISKCFESTVEWKTPLVLPISKFEFRPILTWRGSTNTSVSQSQTAKPAIIIYRLAVGYARKVPNFQTMLNEDEGGEKEKPPDTEKMS